MSVSTLRTTTAPETAAASSSSSDARSGTFVVFGATGAQGGSVARYAARSGIFSSIRLVTRDASKASAKASLAECQKEATGSTNIELVQADFDDRASLDAALAGAQYSFCVTNWWELFFAENPGAGEAGFPAGEKASAIEEKQGKHWVDAVKRAGLKFVIYSGLEDTRKFGFKHIYHYHAKGAVEDYLLANGPAACIVRLPFYMENFGAFLKVQDGKLTAPYGDAALPLISIADFGSVVDGIMRKVVQYGSEYFDKEILGLAAEKIPLEKLVKYWSKVRGSPIKYVPVPAEDFAKFGFPSDIEMAEMFTFQQQHETTARRDVALTKALATDRLTTSEQFFAKNAAKYRE